MARPTCRGDSLRGRVSLPERFVGLESSNGPAIAPARKIPAPETPARFHACGRFAFYGCQVQAPWGRPVQPEEIEMRAATVARRYSW